MNKFRSFSARSVVLITFICCLLLCCLLLCGCGRGAGAETDVKVKTYYNWFDTVTYIYSYAGDTQTEFEALASEVASILDRYNRLFDIYHEYAGMNNLCTLNKNAGAAPLEVVPELLDFLEYSKELYCITEGKMNVMLGSVLELWEKSRNEALKDDETMRQGIETAGTPLPEELENAALHTSIDLLELDRKNGTARISDPYASIDAGAVGKGYAVERAAEYLESRGVSGYAINAGGNVRLVGTKPDGSGWVTGIRNPSGQGLAAKFTLADTSCVTSGAYERFFTVNGVRYHHIIDVDTLFPADHYASVSVVIKDSGLADALSTALFCLPYESSLALAESLGAEALWIFNDGSIRQTPGL